MPYLIGKRWSERSVERLKKKLRIQRAHWSMGGSRGRSPELEKVSQHKVRWKRRREERDRSEQRMIAG